jgi:predicted DCC family thiol-disulfide oxidoreductase YuxK
METFGVIDIVYDARCNFCVRSLRWVRSLARREVFRFHDGNDRAVVAERFPAQSGADTDEAMFAVTPSGEVFRGFFAFRRMMWASPWLYPYLALFYAPGAGFVGPKIYSWISRHRGNLGCSESACDVSGSAGHAPKPQA